MLELADGSEVMLIGHEHSWLRSGWRDYQRALFMHNCLPDGEHPVIKERMSTMKRQRNWDMLEFYADISTPDYDLGKVQFSERDSLEIKMMYQIGTNRYLETRAKINDKTCEIWNIRTGMRRRILNGNFVALNSSASGYEATGRYYEPRDRYALLEPLTNEEIESGKIVCRENRKETCERY